MCMLYILHANNVSIVGSGYGCDCLFIVVAMVVVVWLYLCT